MDSPESIAAFDPDIVMTNRAMNHITQSVWPYTSRLQKGGALLEDMRMLVRAWSHEPAEEILARVLKSNLLNKQTRARLADVYRRAFLPRFLKGPIPNAWTLVRPLEDAEAPLRLVRPVYYWLTALAEPLLGDFCREVLFAQANGVRRETGTDDVLSWFASKGCPWSADVSKRVARGLLAALRDFGILEGKVRKRLAHTSPPLPSLAYIAFCLRLQGANSREVVLHKDWQLFHLSPDEVERAFLHSHQDRLLEYYAAGSVIQIQFPADSLEEYARVVTR